MPPPIDTGAAIKIAKTYSKMNDRVKVSFITAIAIIVLLGGVYILFGKSDRSNKELIDQYRDNADYWRRESEKKDSLLEQRRVEYNVKIDYYQHQLQLIHDEATKKVKQ